MRSACTSHTITRDGASGFLVSGTVDSLITHTPSERSGVLSLNLWGMWILRDTNKRPTNNKAKFRSGKFSGLLRNVVFLGVFGVWVIRELTVVVYVALGERDKLQIRSPSVFSS